MRSKTPRRNRANATRQASGARHDHHQPSHTDIADQAIAITPSTRPVMIAKLAVGSDQPVALPSAFLSINTLPRRPLAFIAFSHGYSTPCGLLARRVAFFLIKPWLRGFRTDPFCLRRWCVASLAGAIWTVPRDAVERSLLSNFRSLIAQKSSLF